MTRCKRCARASLLGAHFRSRCCPACQQYEYGLGQGLGLILYGCVGGAAIVWAAGERRVIVVLLLFYAENLLLCILHEATHALAAVLVGWRVHMVGIGSGGIWKAIPLGRMAIVLHKRPWTGGGFCGTGPPRDGHARAAIAFILAAPLAMHLAAAAIAWRWAPPGVASRLFVALNLLAFAWNAWPREVRGHMARGTDGKLILDLWRRPEEAREVWRQAHWFGPVYVRWLVGDHEQAFALAEEAKQANPRHGPALAAFASTAAMTGRYELALPHAAVVAASEEDRWPRALKALPDVALAAHGHFRGAEFEDYVRGGLLVGTDRLDEVLLLSERRLAAATSEESRALWQACIALALLLARRDLDRAEEAARWAYERLPWVPFVETAWGMARIERGDFAGGLKAFRRARKVDHEGRTAVLHAAWGAVAGERKRLAVLDAPGAWPACRRRAQCPPAPLS